MTAGSATAISLACPACGTPLPDPARCTGCGREFELVAGMPDLRLEYEGPDQELGKVDLELVTGDYHAQGLAAKAQTGFAMYALPEDAARLRPAMSDPEIMLEILSL